MSSPSRKPSETASLNLGFFTIPQEILLQLGTGTVLTALLGSRSVAQTLQAIGQVSEEVFRGDRLPVLKFPVETNSDSG